MNEAVNIFLVILLVTTIIYVLLKAAKFLVVFLPKVWNKL